MHATPSPHAAPPKPRKPRLSTQPVTVALVPTALLRWSTLIALSGLSENALRSLEQTDPTFPRRFLVGRAAVRFVAADATTWLASLARRAHEAGTPAKSSTTPAEPVPERQAGAVATL